MVDSIEYLLGALIPRATVLICEVIESNIGLEIEAATNCSRVK